MNVILISSRIQSFSHADILSMLDKEVVNKIKQTDPHPFFQAYSICHPGISNPKLLDETESKPVTWTQKAVQSLKNLVLKGIKLFKGHNKDNSTNNRDEIGEVIANVEKEINGELNHIVITYHKPEKVEEAKQYDICSQEGVWNFLNSAGQIIADSVEKITGIALGKSTEETPAFSGARKLGMIQCFADTTSSDDGKIKPDGLGVKKMEITFNDVLEFVKSRGIIPSRIYGLDDLKSDKEFSKEFKVFQEKDDQIKKLTDELNSEKKSNAKNSVMSRFDKIIDEIKPTDKIKAHVSLSFKEDVNEFDDLSDDSIKKYIAIQTKAFQRINKEKDDQGVNFNQDTNKDSKDFLKKENNSSLTEDVDLSPFKTIGG